MCLRPSLYLKVAAAVFITTYVVHGVDTCLNKASHCVAIDILRILSFANDAIICYFAPGIRSVKTLCVA